MAKAAKTTKATKASSVSAKTETVKVPVIRFVEGERKGEIDYVSTRKCMDAAVQTYETDRLSWVEAFSTVLTEIFDEQPGLRLDQASLAYEMLNKLNVPLGERSSRVDSAIKYISSVTGERGAAVYGSLRGRNGGTLRWSDQPSEDVAVDTDESVEEDSEE